MMTGEDISDGFISLSNHNFTVFQIKSFKAIFYFISKLTVNDNCIV